MSGQGLTGAVSLFPPSFELTPSPADLSYRSPSDQPREEGSGAEVSVVSVRAQPAGEGARLGQTLCKESLSSHTPTEPALVAPARAAVSTQGNTSAFHCQCSAGPHPRGYSPQGRVNRFACTTLFLTESPVRTREGGRPCQG